MEALIVFGTFVGDLVARVMLSGTTKAARGSLDEMARRFARSLVLRAELVTWPGMDREEAATVRFVVANGNGLSFRDAFGLEVLRVEPGADSGLELIDPGGRPFLGLVRSDGELVEFWLEGVDQGEGLALLDAAIQRN
jgi:hypothetical protein